MLALLAADGGSFTIAPNLGLVLWTLLWLVVVAGLVYGVVWATKRHRRGAGRG